MEPDRASLVQQISKTWAGCPLRTWEELLSYIQQTRTEPGLRVEAERVRAHYLSGLTAS